MAVNENEKVDKSRYKKCAKENSSVLKLNFKYVAKRVLE